MGIVSKLIAAAVVIGVAWLLIDGYGDARYDAGWQAATTEQRDEADKLRRQADEERAKTARQLAELDKILIERLDQVNRLKEEMLLQDESYVKWRSQQLHPVAKERIWGK